MIVVGGHCIPFILPIGAVYLFLNHSRLNGELPPGLRIANNTLIFGRPLDHNDSGTYQCEVTNDIGSRTNTRNIYILGEHLAFKNDSLYDCTKCIFIICIIFY